MPNNFTNMLIGEYIHSVDSKGRTSLPSKFKTMMGERVVLSRGFDKTLTVYTLEAWEKLNEKLSSLSISKEAERRFARFMLSGAVEVEVDKQGRIRIPDFLRDYAEINDKKVV
jgi:MraZ protein